MTKRNLNSKENEVFTTSPRFSSETAHPFTKSISRPKPLRPRSRWLKSLTTLQQEISQRLWTLFSLKIGKSHMLMFRIKQVLINSTKLKMVKIQDKALRQSQASSLCKSVLSSIRYLYISQTITANRIFYSVQVTALKR